MYFATKLPYTFRCLRPFVMKAINSFAPRASQYLSSLVYTMYMILLLNPSSEGKGEFDVSMHGDKAGSSTYMVLLSYLPRLTLVSMQFFIISNMFLFLSSFKASHSLNVMGKVH